MAGWVMVHESSGWRALDEPQSVGDQTLDFAQHLVGLLVLHCIQQHADTYDAHQRGGVGARV